MNATKLKNGTHRYSGRNFCANARAMGDVIQLTFMTGMNPARTVARIWWKVLAPAITAIEARYTVFWMGETYIRVSHFPRHGMDDTYHQIRDEDLHDLSLQRGSVAEKPLKNTDKSMSKRGTDQGAIGHHLGHATAEIVAMFGTIVSEP